MCGEKFCITFYSESTKGSPPHVRGKDQGCVLVCFRMGITPACAGKSFDPNYNQHDIQDHPRMCGEKFDSTPFLLQH